MVRIRLQRHGRKKRPFYYIVAADQRAPRDGRFIERIGSYNPNTNPATIDLDLDASVRWLQQGAVPTDTCKAILSYRGAIYKNHLLKGVKKGALSEEEANKKFDAWLEQKNAQIESKQSSIQEAAAKRAAEAHKREEEVKVAREKAILEKNSPLAEEVVEEVSETVAEEASAEEAPEAVAEEAPEAKAEETPAEEAPEAKAEETPAEEAPEAKAEETPAEEAPEAKAEVTPAEEAPEEAEKAE
ncbi:MAG: 30S ribosomal protein S16 [Bacteroidia bacterium]